MSNKAQQRNKDFFKGLQKKVKLIDEAAKKRKKAKKGSK